MKNILIADDDVLIRHFLREFLEDKGYGVLGEAENGLVALRKYKVLKPDIVLLDVEMPEMNGIDVLKEIKKIDFGANVVMISATENDKTISEAKVNGARAFIAKPFEPSTVVRILNKLFRKRTR